MRTALTLLALAVALSAQDVHPRFAGFDRDGDGTPELARVDALYRSGGDDACTGGPRCLVLVEERLARTDQGLLDLRPRIRRLVDDLAAEHGCAIALSIAFPPSDRHQDGNYVLALRELLRAYASEGDLRAALLLGHFPDALLVRTCNWRRRGDVTLRQQRPDQRVYRGVPFLRRVPEAVAHRADIVLADLDGGWEHIYVQPRTALPTVHAVFADAIPERGGDCVDAARGSVTFEDFFHIDDGRCELFDCVGAAGTAPFFVALDDRAGGAECAPSDRRLPNPIAHPEILVSRIDAHGTALLPRPAIHGEDGSGLLDADGQPRTVTFGRDRPPPDWRRLWQRDEGFERRLLADYLDRNHAFRTGSAPIAFRPASLACDLPSGFAAMARAADAWLPAVPGRSDVSGRPTLTDAADWFALPAVLRTLRAHSDPWGSVFAKPDLDRLAAHLGGPAWSWTPRGDRLEPSLAAACRGGKLDWHLLHTLWRNRRIAPEPCFYVHTGCHAITPPGALRRPFDHADYGRMQGGEALMMFANGLALVGRAKVFYDEPRGFAETLRRGGTFGDAWARYFAIEARAATWSDVGGDIGRKRSYFWSVLGDATLRLARR